MKLLRGDTVGVMTLYEILGVSKDTDATGIRSAYRRLARQCHPDFSGKTDSLRFREIRLAYETLSDPVSRARYDRSLEGNIPIRILPTQSRRAYAEPLISPQPSDPPFFRSHRFIFVEEDPFNEVFRVMERFFAGF